MNTLKKSIDIFFSMATSIVLMSIFAIAIGYATFAESSSGTNYAHQIVYNAVWFEVLLALLIVNLLGSIVRFQLTRKRKLSILVFHLAFIVMIIGAAITRFTGSEGIMHIRQGETTNLISSDKNSLQIIAQVGTEQVEKTVETTFSETENADFSQDLNIGNKTIRIEKELYVPNSVETMVPDDQGVASIALFVMNPQNQTQELILSANDSISIDNQSFVFGNSAKKGQINFTLTAENKLNIITNIPLSTMNMMEKTENTLEVGKTYAAQFKTIYKSEQLIFVIKSYLPKAIKTLTQLTPEMEMGGMKKQGKDAIIFKISDGSFVKKVNVFTSDENNPNTVQCQLGDLNLSLSYGKLAQKLPFSITLREFQLERYAGSNSPSSYASEITVHDPEMKTELPFRIYMNNILKYRGYRFFQSSYDNDEMGTVLSVSNDYWGTMVSYFGYFLMMLGMTLTLFNKNSRFRTLLKLSNELIKKKEAVKLSIIALCVLSTTSLYAQNNSKADHLSEAEKLLIQDGVQGRIEPLSTYASDVIRKITKKSEFNGQSPVEVLIGMSANPTFWANQPIIKVNDPQLAKELGASNNYISFNQMFDFANDGAYKLSGIVDQTYQKEPSTQTKYDKEVLYVDERVNICNEIFSSNMLALFPIPGQANARWKIINPQWKATSASSSCPAGHGSGMDAMEMNDNQMQTMSDETMPNNMGLSDEQLNTMLEGVNATTTATAPQLNSPELLLSNYFKAYNNALSTGNWTAADAWLKRIKTYQTENGGGILPERSKISLEVLYNKFDIFNKLAYTYLMIGFLLLIVNLLVIFKKNTALNKLLNWSYTILLLIFTVYSLGMAIRWYISNHAPWSNGYETMLLVGWAVALAGLVFARKSPIVLAVTAILASIALVVAAMSWMNPEITNLVPVLKSYWLNIHVLIITTSYGFLAMAALLGMLNLSLMIVRKPKNELLLNDTIQGISYIIELAMIVGLFMLTIGCFIGGIWANESWGRYWGWDPKETWALVSILVYSVVLHLRKIKKLNNQFTLSSLSMISFSTIIMTFLGVNYYLTGMHSYAQGSAPSIPSAVYVVVVLMVVLVSWSYTSEKKNGKL